MSLRFFHILFIVVSALLLFGFAGWVFFAANADSEPGLKMLGTGSLLGGIGLVLYLVRFIIKSKKLP